MTRAAYDGAGTAWAPLLGSDPTPWLRGSSDPAARWVTLTGILDRPPGDPDVRAAHRAVLDDPATPALVACLPGWEADGRASGHDSPWFAPNLLNLLADRGLAAGDAVAVDRLLDVMLRHQEPSGRFASYAQVPGADRPVWGALLCDHHAVLEVLVRFGRQDDPRVRAGLERMAADVTETPQGRGWPCVPHSTTGWRGPGRRGDLCPMVTLQALRTFARLPSTLRPDGLLELARVSLRVWRDRAVHKPYMFGHGRQFKTVKWPVTWYGAFAMLDALGRYPDLWQPGVGDPQDTRALAEVAACLVAYNAQPDGTVVPLSTYRGFAEHSFGQKRQPSALATAWLLAVLHRVDGLASRAGEVDVRALAGSKGGAERVMPPRTGR